MRINELVRLKSLGTIPKDKISKLLAPINCHKTQKPKIPFVFKNTSET